MSDVNRGIMVGDRVVYNDRYATVRSIRRTNPLLITIQVDGDPYDKNVSRQDIGRLNRNA